jgi:hypothetical protein
LEKGQFQSSWENYPELPLFILLLTPYLPINLLVLRFLLKFLIQLVIKPITFYGNMVALLKVDTYGKMYKKLRIWGGMRNLRIAGDAFRSPNQSF